MLLALGHRVLVGLLRLPELLLLVLHHALLGPEDLQVGTHLRVDALDFHVQPVNSALHLQNLAGTEDYKHYLLQYGFAQYRTLLSIA